MSRLNVLHVVSWYPTPQDPLKGIFIRRHIDALRPHCENRVLHLETYFYGDKFIRTRKQKLPDGTESYTYQFRHKRWRLAEWLTFWLLFRELVLKRKARNADVINLYIAYPAGLFVKTLRLFLRKPLVFSEQWSAYHFHFHLPPEAPGLNRIRKIFRHKIPLITVSHALGKDIRAFARMPELPYEVVPNVIDTSLFHLRENKFPETPVFFMLNRWSGIKNPMPVLEAFRELIKTIPSARLRIGGEGDRLEEMKTYVREQLQNTNVVFLGTLQPAQVSEELRSCTALLQPTRYETFSVICAEALCCGTPVIASKTGGIVEFVHAQNGLLVEEADAHHWLNAMHTLLQQQHTFDAAQISQEAQAKFSAAAAGKAYYELLKRFAGTHA